MNWNCWLFVSRSDCWIVIRSTKLQVLSALKTLKFLIPMQKSPDDSRGFFLAAIPDPFIR